MLSPCLGWYWGCRIRRWGRWVCHLWWWRSNLAAHLQLRMRCSRLETLVSADVACSTYFTIILVIGELASKVSAMWYVPPYSSWSNIVPSPSANRHSYLVMKCWQKLAHTFLSCGVWVLPAISQSLWSTDLRIWATWCWHMELNLLCSVLDHHLDGPWGTSVFLPCS